MAIHHFEGRILDRALAGDLSALAVQAWDLQRRFKAPVAVVSSDKEGMFAFQFDDAELKELFGGVRPVLFFRVVSASVVLASTERNLKWDAQGDGRGNIQLQTDRPI